jgi:M61 glycyl aminopeptidase
MRLRRVRMVLAAGLWLAFGLPAISAEPLAPPVFAVTLRPLFTASAGKVFAVEVSLSADEIHAAAGAPLLRLPITTSNVQTSALTLYGLTVRDAQGVVPLTVRDQKAGADEIRQWLVARSVNGKIAVEYSVPIDNAPNLRGSAPPLELRSDGAVFSGAGSTFLLLPETAVPYRIRLHWDFSAMPSNASGLSSFGIGDVSDEAPLTLDRLTDAFYMGGLAGRQPTGPSRAGFFGAWQGEPPFDAKRLLAWTERLYDYYFEFFRPSLTPYGVFLRPNLINAGGGRAFPGSFVGTFGPDTQLAQFKGTLAHEMIHTFVGHLDNATPRGAPAATQDTSGESGAWYAEGTAVYYQRLMPLRAGLMTPDEFLADLNFNAGRYYTNALNTLSDKEIPGRFWEDTRIRTLPYDRGSFYFATVDAEVRKESGGRRSVDNLVLQMINLHRNGRRVTQADWITLISKELGPSARIEFESMLAGAVVVPPSDAFGPCFRRITRPMRRYEIGFDPKVLIEPDRVIHGLVPGSAAEKAGLRNGDRIVKPVPQDLIQGEQDQILTLEIQRGDQHFPVAYLPRGETVSAYQWERVADAPANMCAVQFRVGPPDASAINSPPRSRRLSQLWRSG